jgi:PAS domain S-box-containing protein
LVNKEFEKCFGIGAEKALGKTSSEIRGPETAALSQKHEKTVLETGNPVVFEDRVDNRGDGVLRDYHIVKFPVKNDNGKVLKLGSFSVDITERKTTENALRESEERLLAIADNSTNTITLKDAQGRILFANKEFAAEFDLTPDEVAGYSVRELRDDGELSSIIERSDAAVVESGEANSTEFEYVHKGKLRARKLDKFPIRDGHGKIKQIASIGTDISERIVIEKALRISEERFRGFAESSADWLWETDAQGRFTYISDRFSELIGVQTEYVIGKSAAEICQNLDFPGITKAVDDLIDERQVIRDVQYRLPNKDGHWLTVRSSGKPRFDENQNFLGYRGTTTDVTSEVEARENEAKVQERFLTSIETVPMAVALFDADDRLVVSNQRYRDLLISDAADRDGVTFEEIVRAEVKAGALIEAAGQEEAWIRKRLEDHRNPLGAFELSRSNGISQVREHRTGDGYTLIISNDITEQKKIEEMLVRARDELEIRVYERTHALEQEIFERKYAQAELIKANEELERRVDERTKHLQDEVAERKRFEAQLVQAQKMEAVGQMAGGIAHDFNNLLTVVLANLGWLQEFTEDNSRARRMTNLALEGARRAGELTQRMLAFSRRQELAPVTIDLSETLHRFQPLISRALGETISIEMSMEADLWPVNVDPNQFESSILNIAINSRDAMTGGGSFTLIAKNRPGKNGSDLTIDNETGDAVEISLTDTGFGIPDETLKRVFDPFFTTKDVGRGSGLGLSMVFGFVKQSGGFVEIDSEEGKGTTVRMVLPRTDGKSKVKTALIKETEAVKTDGMRVLVVEDDEMVRNVTVEYLKMAGLSVNSAENADFALAAMEDDGPVDLVISDVIMPGTSGVELASVLKKKWPDTRVVLMTGYSYDEFSRRGIDPKSMKLLRKPFSRNELLTTINEAMQ